MCLSLHFPSPPDGGRNPKAIWTPGHWAWHDIHGTPPEESARWGHCVIQGWSLDKLKLWERKRVMAVLTPQGSLHDFPTLGKSMSEVVTFSSIYCKALSLSFHALTACCQCKAWSSAMWEGGAHCSGKVIFISPEASISHATGKNISRNCSIHYFK